MMEFNLGEAIEAANEDGYEEIKNLLGGSKFDLDFKELLNENETLWETNSRRLHIDFKNNGNVCEVTVSDIDENMYEGYCCTYDGDSIGLAYATMGALKEFVRINDL